MSVYYDTGALIKLYVEEDFSDPVTVYVSALKKPIALHAFHEVELENALRLKVFRKELTKQECHRVLRRIADDVSAGILARQGVNWADAMREAVRLSSDVTERTGCRTLDVLHVALALHWRCAVFVSLDDRQIKAAKLAGLKVVDVRRL